MSQWPATKAKRVLTALLRIGWGIKRQASGSHRTLSRTGWPDFTGDVGTERRGRWHFVTLFLLFIFLYHPIIIYWGDSFLCFALFYFVLH